MWLNVPPAKCVNRLTEKIRLSMSGFVLHITSSIVFLPKLVGYPNEAGFSCGLQKLLYSL